MKFRALVVLASLALVAGCSGGSGSTPAAINQVVVTPTSAPAGAQFAALTISFPYTGPASSARSPQYVSPNSAKVDVKVNSVNGGALPSWVPADTVTALTFGGGGNCTVSGGTATCTVTIAAPPGSVNYTFNDDDSSLNVLATLTTTLTIVQGQSNLGLTAALQGVVKTVTVTGPTLAANSPLSIGVHPLGPISNVVTVTAFDFSGAQIVNGTTPTNYNNPITLTDTDPTGSTQLKVNGGTAASIVVVNSPADVVTIVYTGQAENNFTITAGGTGITGGGTITTLVNDITFTGTTLDSAGNGGLNTDPNFGQQTLFFSSPSGSQNVTGAEVGYTNAPYNLLFTIALDATTCGSGASAVASASAGPATTFTITAKNVGICKAKLSETGTGYPITQHTANTSGNPTHDGTFWISVSGANIIINGSHH
jgi:hypothetical protein